MDATRIKLLIIFDHRSIGTMLRNILTQKLKPIGRGLEISSAMA